MDEIFYEKHITCAICENTFKTTKIRSTKIRPGKMDTDLCRYYDGENPYFYDINVCPKCGFAFSDNFNEYLSQFQKNKFKEAVSRNWDKNDYCGSRDIATAIKTYKLALLGAQVMELKNSTIAGMLLRISWLNRLINNKEEEMRFMKGAADYYEKAYQGEDFKSKKGMSPEIIVYLLGELNYRMGNYSETVKWFNLAITRYSHSTLIKKQTAEMIRDRWLEIKQELGTLK